MVTGLWEKQCMRRMLIQGIKFIGLSGIGWLLDFCLFTLLGLFSDDVITNNMISSWVGVTFVFLTATRTVFKNNGRLPLKWKYVIYLAYQFVLIFCASRLLSLINQWITTDTMPRIVRRFSALISKAAVTPITMVLNFFTMKALTEKL